MKSKFTSLFLFLLLSAYSGAFSQITLNANATSNNGSGGIFLSLTTNTTPVAISKFNTFFGSTNGTALNVEVFTRAGSYTGFTTANTGWTLAGTVPGVSAGTTTLAPLDVSSLNLKVEAASTLSIYLHSITAGGGIRYFGTGTTSTTNFSDANLVLFSDISRTGAVAFGGTQFSPRAFAGSIEYFAEALPLKWLEVTAKNEKGNAVINWKVDEIHVRKYELEKQTGNSYETVATLSSKGDGLNNYSITDTNPFGMNKNTVLYRIKQTDLDGRSTYSRSLLVRKAEIKELLNVYPNPCTINTQVLVGSRQKASITDMAGKTIATLNLNAGSNYISTESWLPGVYLLITENGERVKIVRE